MFWAEAGTEDEFKNAPTVRDGVEDEVDTEVNGT